jgi:hypothetical protein
VLKNVFFKSISFIFEEMGLHNQGQNLAGNELSSYQNIYFGCTTHSFGEFEIKKIKEILSTEASEMFNRRATSLMLLVPSSLKASNQERSPDVRRLFEQKKSGWLARLPMSPP